jgi:hypothetical protein
MKKIRLNTDELEVFSFATAPMPRARGTVQGASGNTCYFTVGYYQTNCLAYPMSYWHENTCDCPLVPVTEDLRCQPETGPVRCAPLDTVDVTCMTCPGQPGC